MIECLVVRPLCQHHIWRMNDFGFPVLHLSSATLWFWLPHRQYFIRYWSSFEGWEFASRYLVRLLNTCEKLSDSAKKKLESRQQSAIAGSIIKRMEGTDPFRVVKRGIPHELWWEIIHWWNARLLIRRDGTWKNGHLEKYHPWLVWPGWMVFFCNGRVYIPTGLGLEMIIFQPLVIEFGRET